MEFNNLRLIKILPGKTIKPQNGEFKLKELIFETEESYPKKICISFWGDKFDDTEFTIENKYKAQVDIESKEFNEKWFANIKAWKIESLDIEN